MTTFFDAFISYGRPDSLDFGIELSNRLRKEGFKVWFDKDHIKAAEDFQKKINDGIEKAHNFLFIISPHSVNSKYCRDEIELALKLNKRIIPLLHVMQISPETWKQRNPNSTDENWEAYKAKGFHHTYNNPNMEATIGKLHSLDFQKEKGKDNFEKSIADLIKVLCYDADYVKQHTQFFARALEWERHQKQTNCLLIGEEKKKAEEWLKKGFKDKQQPCIPTDLHCEYITESIKNANNLMTQVFLCYSHKDKEVMKKLAKTLMREGFTVWTNKTDIKTGTQFQEEVNKGIEGADNVICLISPAALQSWYCQQEIAHAFANNKRIIPLLIEPTELGSIHPNIRVLQFIDFTTHQDEAKYRHDANKLVKILHQDERYYEEHKILLVKALKWQEQNRNHSILLRGHNLQYYEYWLKVHRHRGEHPPLPLQVEFVRESSNQPPESSLEVFISYSRADSDFARKLNQALQIQGKTTWFDQESIPPGSDFQQEIYRGIESSANFLFIISPRSVNSPYCADEVEYAQKLNKRFVTILYTDVSPKELHPALASVQWIDFNRHGGDFYPMFSELVRTLDTDREHVQSHTKWSQRALEWEEKGKSADLLLRGSEFAIAQNWLQEAEQQNKQPAATPLQKALIEASKNAIEAAEEEEKRRQAEMLRLQEERTKEAEARLALQKKSAKLQWFFLGAVSIALVVAFRLWGRAETVQDGQINSVSRFSLALSAEDQKLDALIEAIRAGRRLQEKLFLIPVSSETRSLVLTALQAAVYKPGFRERNRFIGHEYSVNSASFSPDGQIIATTSGDTTAKLWSHEGKFLNTLRGHNGTVNSVSFSPDGKTIASASFDKSVILWSRDSELLHTLKGHTDTIYSVGFSSDGQTIATSSQDKTVKLWSRGGKLLQTLPHKDGVSSVSFSPDGKIIASAIYNPPIVTLWNRKGKPLKILVGHKAPIYSVSFSPDGQTIASASQDNTIILWNRDKGIKQLTLKGHDGSVQSVVFSPDGKTIASASKDKTVILWNRAKGFRELTLKGHKDELSSVSFSPDGKTIVSASRDKTVKLWNREGKELQALTGHTELVKSLAWSPDGKMIASASFDKTVKLWSREGKVFNILHSDLVSSVSFSPDGQTIATTSRGNTVKLWSREGKLLQILPHQDGVYSVSFSPDGQTIAVGSKDTTVRLWSREGKLLHTLKGHKEEVNSVAWSPDSKTIASGSGDSFVRLWSREGQLLQTLMGHKQDVHSVSFSPDGQTIASASKDGTVKLWSLEGKTLQTLMGHDDEVKSVVFNPDGKKIASASSDRTVKLWTREGQLLQTLMGHKGKVYSVSFSPDGKTIASASQDKTVILWNLEDLQLDRLMQDACDWVRDYLKYNSKVKQSDRTLCDDINEK
jgi:WD40 repeat protein